MSRNYAAAALRATLVTRQTRFVEVANKNKRQLCNSFSCRGIINREKQIAVFGLDTGNG